MSSDSEDNFEGSSESDSLGDDLTYGQSDAKWLASLTDIQREEVFFERLEKKKEAEELKKIKKDSRQRKGRDAKPLKVKRKQASAIEEIRKKQVKQKKAKAASSSASEASEPDEFDLYANKRKHDEIAEIIIDIEQADLQRAIVSRTNLEKWYGEPFFLKNLPGVFIRVVSGGGFSQHNRDYKIAEIISFVETSKVYKLGKKECKHLATLKIGETLKKYELQYVSNSPVTELEYQQWLETAKLHNEVPTKAQLEGVADQIKHCANYQYTSEDFREQIKKNREKNPNFIGSSFEILRLKDMLLEETDERKQEELKAQIRAAEERENEKKKKVHGKIGSTLEALNKRNEKMNTVLTRTVIDDDEYELDESSAFRQRATKSRNSWVAKPRKLSDSGSKDANADKVEPVNKKQKTDQEPAQPIVPNLAEVEIQLDNADLSSEPTIFRTLSNLGVSTPQAVAPVRTAKTLPADVKTLSLADYKKRMGYS